MTEDRPADYPLTFPPPARPVSREPRVRASRVVLWAARVFLVGVPLAVAASWARWPALRHRPLTAETLEAHPWGLVALLLGVVWLVLLPVLVLPFGSVRLTRFEDQRLVVETVLGTRRLQLPAQAVGLATLRNGGWPETWYLGIRRGWRWVVVVASGGFEFPEWLVRGVGNFPVNQYEDRTGNVVAGLVLAIGWAVVALGVAKLVLF